MRVIVTGLGVTGMSVAQTLLHRGAHVTVLDESDTLSDELASMGADVRTGVHSLPSDLKADLLIASPGWPPSSPILQQAEKAGIPLWGDVELAWRMRPENPAPWIAVTGTNGKTTTVGMLTSMLSAGGSTAIGAGNIGTPILDAVLARPDVIAVELSSYQLHRLYSMSAESSACLNIHEDHLDWHGSMKAYRDAKAKIYERTQIAAVYNVQDPQTQVMVDEADVVEGCRAIGFTLGVPSVGMVGVVEDLIVDRAFVDSQQEGLEIVNLADIDPSLRSGGFVPTHVLSDILAAAALARAHGVAPQAIGDAMRSFTIDAHRGTCVNDIGGVKFIDDSKATNPHAAQAALSGFEKDSVVWIAGGLAKGASFDELVSSVADRLHAVVLIGEDQHPLQAALDRHAPRIPVTSIETSETEGGTNIPATRGGRVMTLAVQTALSCARPGDAVVLAPACASMDQFDSYATRGDLFVSIVEQLKSSTGQGE